MTLSCMERIMPFSTYAVFDFRGWGRTSAFFELLLVGSIVIASELILGNQKLKDDFDIRSFRLAIFTFSIPLVIYPELFSRFLFFYFAAEMFFVISSIWAAEARVRLASAVIFIAYGIAPNDQRSRRPRLAQYNYLRI